MIGLFGSRQVARAGAAAAEQQQQEQQQQQHAGNG
jgi:hypothetical protein